MRLTPKRLWDKIFLIGKVEIGIRLWNTQLKCLKMYAILEGAKGAKGLTSWVNFVSLDQLQQVPRVKGR